MEVEQSKALRVCHISTAHPADDTRVFWREAVGLASLGYDVTLFARDRFTGDRNGVRLVGLPTYDRRLMRMTVGTIRALRAASSVGADIYHVHDPELLPGLAVFHLLGRRTVYDAHELLSAQVLSKPYLPARARVIAGFVARGLERLAALASDEIITVSPACAIPFPETKTTIVANYPGRDELSISDSDVGGRDEPLRVIYLGGIARSRGILELIEAMSLINRTHAIRLTLIGPFENESMLAEARSHRGWRYVDYLGVLPHVEVGSHLVGAVAGVVNFLPSPNNSVGSPNKLFEYMAAGIPVVASNFPLWREIVEGVGCGVCIDPTVPASIASGVIELVDDEARSKKMGSAGRAAMLQQFNWEEQLEHLDSAYQRLMKRRPLK